VLDKLSSHEYFSFDGLNDFLHKQDASHGIILVFYACLFVFHPLLLAFPGRVLSTQFLLALVPRSTVWIATTAVQSCFGALGGSVLQRKAVFVTAEAVQHAILAL